MTHEKETEARGAAETAVEATKDKRWMIAVWVFDEETKDVHLSRVTWKFPVGDLQNSLDLLEDNLIEMLNPLVPELPSAPEFLLPEVEPDPAQCQIPCKDSERVDVGGDDA